MSCMQFQGKVINLRKELGQENAGFDQWYQAWRQSWHTHMCVHTHTHSHRPITLHRDSRREGAVQANMMPSKVRRHLVVWPLDPDGQRQACKPFLLGYQTDPQKNQRQVFNVFSTLGAQCVLSRKDPAPKNENVFCLMGWLKKNIDFIPL